MKKINYYTDGVMKIYKKATDKNIRNLSDMEYIGKLAFDMKNIRESDMEFAMQQDKQLTLKIVTQDMGIMDTNVNVVIDDAIYAVIKMDRDRQRRELYWYLTEVRKVDRCY